MYKLTDKDNKFINDNFGNVEILKSYCEDYAQLKLTSNKKIPPLFEIAEFSTYKNDGTTTGIVCGVDTTNDNITLSLLVEGSFKWAVADENTLYNLFIMQNKLKENPGNYSDKEIENFDFLLYKPFILTVVNSQVNLIKPLRFDIYEEALALNEKILADEIE